MTPITTAITLDPRLAKFSSARLKTVVEMRRKQRVLVFFQTRKKGVSRWFSCTVDQNNNVVARFDAIDGRCVRSMLKDGLLQKVNDRTLKLTPEWESAFYKASEPKRMMVSTK